MQGNDRDDPPGCDIEKMAWSGLLECGGDNVTALRTSRAYASDLGIREKVDQLSKCLAELARRLTQMKSLPGHGEPSFTLLARDPMAAATVAYWSHARGLLSDPADASKIDEAAAVVTAMQAWRDGRERHPGPLYVARESEVAAVPLPRPREPSS